MDLQNKNVPKDTPIYEPPDITPLYNTRNSYEFETHDIILENRNFMQHSINSAGNMKTELGKRFDRLDRLVSEQTRNMQVHASENPEYDSWMGEKAHEARFKSKLFKHWNNELQEIRKELNKLRKKHTKFDKNLNTRLEKAHLKIDKITEPIQAFYKRKIEKNSNEHLQKSESRTDKYHAHLWGIRKDSAISTICDNANVLNKKINSIEEQAKKVYGNFHNQLKFLNILEEDNRAIKGKCKELRGKAAGRQPGISKGINRLVDQIEEQRKALKQVRKQCSGGIKTEEDLKEFETRKKLIFSTIQELEVEIDNLIRDGISLRDTVALMDRRYKEYHDALRAFPSKFEGEKETEKNENLKEIERIKKRLYAMEKNGPVLNELIDLHKSMILAFNRLDAILISTPVKSSLLPSVFRSFEEKFRSSEDNFRAKLLNPKEKLIVNPKDINHEAEQIIKIIKQESQSGPDILIKSKFKIMFDHLKENQDYCKKILPYLFSDQEVRKLVIHYLKPSEIEKPILFRKEVSQGDRFEATIRNARPDTGPHKIAKASVNVDESVTVLHNPPKSITSKATVQLRPVEEPMPSKIKYWQREIDNTFMNPEQWGQWDKLLSKLDEQLAAEIPSLTKKIDDSHIGELEYMPASAKKIFDEYLMSEKNFINGLKEQEKLLRKIKRQNLITQEEYEALRCKDFESLERPYKELINFTEILRPQALCRLIFEKLAENELRDKYFNSLKQEAVNHTKKSEILKFKIEALKELQKEIGSKLKKAAEAEKIQLKEYEEELQELLTEFGQISSYAISAVQRGPRHELLFKQMQDFFNQPGLLQFVGLFPEIQIEATLTEDIIKVIRDKFKDKKDELNNIQQAYNLKLEVGETVDLQKMNDDIDKLAKLNNPAEQAWGIVKLKMTGVNTEVPPL